MSNPTSVLNPRDLYEVCNQVLLRTPILPISTLAELDLLDDAFIRKILLSRNRTPLLALAIGSPSLFEAFTRLDEDAKLPQSIKSKLLRFINRMSSRPTPFGLFAGVALAEFGDITNVRITGHFQRKSRPDMGWLSSFLNSVREQFSLTETTRLITNPNTKVEGGRAFLDSGKRDGTNQTDAEISIRATGPVKLSLLMCTSPWEVSQLVTCICEKFNAPHEKAFGLIESLWRQNFLLDDLYPPLDSNSPSRVLAERLRKTPSLAIHAEQWSSLLLQIAGWDELPADEAIPAYSEIGIAAAAIHEANDRNFLQVDARCNTRAAKLASTVASEACKAAIALLRFTTFPSGPNHVHEYRKRFEERYSIGQEVPLLELIDPDCGLGPLETEVVSSISPSSVQRRDRALLDLATRALWNRQSTIFLDQDSLLDELTTWEPNENTCPASIDLIFGIASRSAEAVDNGEFELVVSPNVGAPAAGKYMARFCHVLGEKSEEQLSLVSKLENDNCTDAIIAELLFQPRQARIANVIIRPNCRSYSIPVGVHPSEYSGNIVPLNEIHVGVRNGRFYLSVPSLGRLLRVSNMHMLNHSLSNDICRVLSELGRDGIPQLMGFDWGSANSFPYLPRVQFGKIVLRLAEWKIRSGLLSSKLRLSAIDFTEAFSEYRTQWHIPRFVFLVETDNRILLDLDSPTTIDDLRKEVGRLDRGTPFILLQEALPSPEQCWVEGDDGSYASEFAVSLIKKSAQTSLDVKGNQQPWKSSSFKVEKCFRTKSLGSDWLFLKLYLPRRAMVGILTDQLPSFAHELISNALIKKWFFIRYADPQQHLRIRFNGEPDVLTKSVIPKCIEWCRSLESQGLVSRFGFDTYEREVERYGGVNSMELMESCFWVDSESVVRYLRLADIGQGDNELIDLAVISLYAILGALGVSSREIVSYGRSLKESRDESGKEFRIRGSRIRNLIRESLNQHTEGVSKTLKEISTWINTSLEPARLSLSQIRENSQSSSELFGVIGSISHMHCNRILGIDAELESLTLGLLTRVVESMVATGAIVKEEN